jgi:hypothetical protein
VQNGNMTRRTIQCVRGTAWAAVIAIAYATLTHVDFVYAIYFKLSPLLMGPAMQSYAHFEHFIALIALLIQFGFNVWRLRFACFSLPMYEFWQEGLGQHIFSGVTTASAIVFVLVSLCCRPSEINERIRPRSPQFRDARNA